MFRLGLYCPSAAAFSRKCALAKGLTADAAQSHSYWSVQYFAQTLSQETGESILKRSGTLFSNVTAFQVQKIRKMRNATFGDHGYYCSDNELLDLFQGIVCSLCNIFTARNECFPVKKKEKKEKRKCCQSAKAQLPPFH